MGCVFASVVGTLGVTGELDLQWLASLDCLPSLTIWLQLGDSLEHGTRHVQTKSVAAPL